MLPLWSVTTPEQPARPGLPQLARITPAGPVKVLGEGITAMMHEKKKRPAIINMGF